MYCDKVRLYTNVDNVGYPTLESSSARGGENWMGPNGTLYSYIDNRFNGVKIEGLSRRGEGGRAYLVKVHVPSINRDLTFDLREEVMLEIIEKVGIKAGGFVDTEFCFISEGSQTKLKLAANYANEISLFEAHRDSVDNGLAAVKHTIKKKDLVIGATYQKAPKNIQESLTTYTYLGESMDSNARVTPMYLVVSHNSLEEIEEMSDTGTRFDILFNKMVSATMWTNPAQFSRKPTAAFYKRLDTVELTPAIFKGTYALMLNHELDRTIDATEEELCAQHFDISLISHIGLKPAIIKILDETGTKKFKNPEISGLIPKVRNHLTSQYEALLEKAASIGDSTEVSHNSRIIQSVMNNL